MNRNAEKCSPDKMQNSPSAEMKWWSAYKMRGTWADLPGSHLSSLQEKQPPAYEQASQTARTRNGEQVRTKQPSPPIPEGGEGEGGRGVAQPTQPNSRNNAGIANALCRQVGTSPLHRTETAWWQKHLPAYPAFSPSLQWNSPGQSGRCT